MTNLKKALLALAMVPVMALSVKAEVKLDNLDNSYTPGQDFYQYACGGWMKANPLEDQYSSFGSFNVLNEENKKHLKELFEDLAKSNAKPGTVAQKVSDLYLMYMDSTRLNNEGCTPIKGDLAMVAKFKKSKENLTDIIGKMSWDIGNPFLGVGVMADMMNSSVNMLYVNAPGFGLPDRDDYLNTDAKSKKTQATYRAYLEKLLTLSGFKKAEAKRMANNVYKFEYQIAESSLSRTEQRDLGRLYNVRTIDQLKKDYSNLDWDKYFASQGLSGFDKVIVTEPKALAKSNELMGKMTEQEIKDYLATLVVTGASSRLSDAYRDADFNFYSKYLNGTKAQQPRWKRAMALPNGMLGEAVGELYVSKYFPQESKQKMVALVNNLRRAFAERISKVDWMSDSTKVNALVKLNSISVKIGYPDKWKDYSNLTVDPKKSLYENCKAYSVYATKKNYDKLHKPVDRDEWGMTPQTVNAYYDPMNNEIVFPAAILQPPFFDPKADDAVNYGAIGVVIGHEMTHGFDDMGRHFDQNGNMIDWWAKADADKFTKITDGLVAQFDTVHVTPDVCVNGRLTLGENTADQGGLQIAYTAFKKTQQGNSNEKIDGFTPDQRFYLSYASVWAENNRPEAVVQQTKNDPHPIGRCRVNNTLRNIEQFYKAFNIKQGDALYLAPEKRVNIW